MSRPATITDAQILQAARTVFLERGVQGTTAEVARRAGVAEGSIFKRFPTKHQLFKAAMRTEFEEPAWLKRLGERVGKGEVQKTLVEVGLQVVDFFRTLLPLIMMSWAARGERGGLPDELSAPNPPPVRALKQVAAFFEAEMRARRIARHDPEILARAFIGGLQNYVFFEMVLKAQDELPLPAEMYVRGLVGLLWSGAAPHGNKRDGAAKRL
jgi:AcrR family transcriptional regulator